MEDKQPPKQEPLEREILIGLNLQTSHVPHVFDLSLAQPFEIFFGINIGISGDEVRPLTFLTTDSAFDGASAISSGLIQLIDLEDDTVIDLQNIDKTSWSSGSFISNAPSLIDSIVTITPKSILPRSVTVFKNRFDHELPLELPTNIKGYLKAGHNYRLKLVVKDLNIQWWAWDSASELGITSTTTPETLPARATGKIVAAGEIVARGITHRDFRVVESFPNPPAITVKLLPAPLPSSNTFDSTNGDEQDEGKRKEEKQLQTQTNKPRVMVSVTNAGSEVITVKSAFRQLYICPINEDHPHGRVQDCDRITSTYREPCIRNFSIVDSSTSEELSPNWISPCGTPTGHKRARNFTTLKPGVPVSTVTDFPERFTKMMQGKRCVLNLRTSEVAWIEGDVEELLREADERGEAKMGLWMTFQRNLRPPLILKCEDQLIYELPTLPVES